uniref:non-specific serine/threonine protein kinase n=1 Tax=Daucus carota subsp. sativus TaxID=79200 RepID=A0A166DZ51_DAUCS
MNTSSLLVFSLMLYVSIWVCIGATPVSAAPSASPSTNSSDTCPIDFGYVTKVQWPSSDCKDFQKNHNNSQCCQTLLSLFGIGLSKYLKNTSLFQLPNLPTSVSCLSDFQSNLNSLSLPSSLALGCFDPFQFVTTPDICAGIQSTHDWLDKLGSSTQVDSSCRPDLTDLSACGACVAAGLRVQADLIGIDGNSSHSTDCFYFAILYAAGIVNQLGPESKGSVTCIFGLKATDDSKGKSKSALVFGLTGGLVAILVMSLLVGLYFWYERKKRRDIGKTSRWGGSGEMESRSRMRPNTGSIWYKFHELEMATDNFSEKNFIGRGGFGLVYKGTLYDGSVVAVKKIIESDFQGNAEFCNEVEIISNLKHRNLVPLRGCCITGDDKDKSEDIEMGDEDRYLVYDYMPNGNLDDHLFPSSTRKLDQALDASLLGDGDSDSLNPKGIMERFILVGILCAHVMVALRPTISDALKMLEGDIEVPTIPDRPMSLAHPSAYKDANNFSMSPALSGLQLLSGDMLR